MSRYIDQDKVIDAVLELDTTHRVSWRDAVVDMIDAMPSADVQPVVLCKDCKYAHITYRGEVKYCDIWFPDESHYMDTDNYCSFAERKGADE